MGLKAKFYWVMVVTLVILGANALVSWDRFEAKVSDAVLQRFETLTYERCVERRAAVLKEMEVAPRTAWEYFAVMKHVRATVGSARKAMLNPPPTWTDTTRRDFRIDDAVRSTPVTLEQGFNEYAMRSGDFSRLVGFEAAKDDFEKSGLDPLRQPDVVVPGAELVLRQWFLFHVVGMVLVFFHFIIQLRSRRLKVVHDVVGNPAFPFWLLFWEVGIFRYPKNVSPAEQLRRAQRWATIVLSSAVSCIAGGAGAGTCEKKPEPAKQHQQYDGVWSRISFSTGVASQYLGLDGASFFSQPVEQSTVTVSLPCGFYVGLFDSEPLAGRNNIHPNFGREVDETFGWSRKFGKEIVDVSATHINVSPITTLWRGDVMQFSERLTRVIALNKRTSVAPYLWSRQAIPIRGSTPGAGWFIHSGAAISRSFGEKVSLSLGAEALRDSGAFGFHRGYIGRWYGGLNWVRGRGIAFQLPQVTFDDPISRVRDGRGPVFAIGAGMTFAPGH